MYTGDSLGFNDDSPRGLLPLNYKNSQNASPRFQVSWSSLRKDLIHEKVLFKGLSKLLFKS